MQVLKTKELSVHCDGESGGSGHPRIYLKIKESEGIVKCPYCGQVFEYQK